MPDSKTPRGTPGKPEFDRADAVRHALGSAAIEGVILDADTEALYNDWAAGKLSDEELLERAINGPGAGRRGPESRG